MLRANFVEETAIVIAGVNGNGAVTMGQIDGLPRISHALGTGTVYISYIMEDLVNKKMESGIGSVTDGVLTRTKPQTTWDGVNYKNYSPAPLAFGSNPAPGTVRIRIGITAETAPPQHPGIIPAGYSSDVWNQYPFSPHYGGMSGGGSSFGISPSTEYHCYYRLDYAGRLTGMQLENTATSSGGTIRMGLYTLGPDALPHKLLASTDYLDISATGIKTASNPANWAKGQELWLNPGWYSFVFTASYGISMRGLLNSNSTGTGPSPVGRTGPSYAGYKSMLTRYNGNNDAHWQPLNDVLTATNYGIAGAQIPWVGMRVQP